MSETLEQTCARDPKWAAGEIERLRASADATEAARAERGMIRLKIHLGVPFERENFPANSMHHEAAKVIVRWLRGLDDAKVLP